MLGEGIYRRYQDLQEYVGWSDEDVTRILALQPTLAKGFVALVDDFYQEIQRHPAAAVVITGGPPQIQRLKQSLMQWLEQLLSGCYDREYLQRRWAVGIRHAEIGLDQVFTNVAMSRLRQGLMTRLFDADWKDPQDLSLAIVSVNRLIDLDLSIIEDSYEFHRMKLEKDAERQKSEVKFRNLVEAAACMIVILKQDLSVAYFSPFAEHLTGYKLDEVLQQDYLELFVGEQLRNDAGDHFQQVLEGTSIRDYEIPIRCRDGSLRWLMWNARRIDDFEGDAAILAVGHDFTERRKSAERLLQSERLAAIGQTITGLAHESRNVLQRINSCTEMLKFELEENEEAMQLLDRSQLAQDDLQKLFNEVRDFAAPIILELSECQLSGIWNSAWDLLQHDWQDRDAVIIEEVPDGLPEVRVDRFRLTQVFRNLLENSLAACTDPVQIRIAVSVAERSINVRIQDNGPGLSREAKEQIFQPFFTTKAKGTGLGMAIANRVLDAHGGTITIGQSGGGAEFLITIPRR